MKINEDVNLDLKVVDSINGSFFIPSYQRGYRWGCDEVLKLLADIYDNKDKPYCLQPIVVKNTGTERCKMIDGRDVDLVRYELIDGQQRLTSLFLIYSYIRKAFKPTIRINFLIDYKTRPDSRSYLLNPTEEDAGKYIDFHYMKEAYDTIERFFLERENPTLAADEIYSSFCKYVKVIWYEVRWIEPLATHESSPQFVDHSDSNHSIGLFTRLNIGKIPLSNAELVKALFLSRDSGLAREKQLEIATTWDTIEHELHNHELWAFLTNAPALSYATRIELLFDMIAHKQPSERNEFFTFEYFMSRIHVKNADNTGSASRIKIADEWAQIQRCYLRLKGWFENRTLFHKIGFLVTTEHDLAALLDDGEKMGKQEFQDSLDKKIKDSLSLSRDEFLSLSYLRASHKSQMEKLLLLFNVESVGNLSNSTERYSFSAYKAVEQKGWSLEHIHAQDSEGLSTVQDWTEWLKMHRESLTELKFIQHDPQKMKSLAAERDELIQNIDTALLSITRDQFTSLFPRVVSLLSESGDTDYLHTMANMALLSRNMNSALKNATFAVKRARMLEMDKSGEYIPLCTRRVFLKYYTSTDQQQLSFWGKHDRNAYIEKFIGTDKNPNEGILTRYLANS